MNLMAGRKDLYFNFIVLLLATFFNNYLSSSVQLHSSNINDILLHNELVFVNFYADWCRFSQILSPVYDEAAGKVKEEFPQEGKVVFGKVDCDKESGISSQYHVSKYPTLKLFRYGQLTKREYRGQRSADALAQFVKEQLKDNIQRVASMDDLDNIDRKKRHVIGYFDSEQGLDFANYQRVASMLRDDCQFYAAVGEMSSPERIAGNKLLFRPTNVDHSDIPYTGSMSDQNLLQAWSTDKCVPLVREITFENAEELTEEGLPFLILFHHPDDTETAEAFRRIVSRELITEKNTINCLIADGLKFSHPLYHLGKTTNDLPILAIDSFRHMYLWPHSAKADIERPGLLKQFVTDLHSGKLHREFHHGPDATQVQQNQLDDKSHIPKDNDGKPAQPTTPPESTFKKLAPSRNRYTLIRDEL